MNTVLLLLFFVCFFALTWRKVEYGVYILVAALPLYVVRFFLFGLPSTLLEGMILILFFVWCIQERHRLLEKGNIFFKHKAFTVSILLFFFASCVSVIIAPHFIRALGLWRAYILEPILFFFVLSDTIRGKNQMTRILIASIVSGCSIALYGIFQKITGFNIPMEWILERRITSIYPYPNAVGLYLAPILVLAITLLAWQLSVMKLRRKCHSALDAESSVLGKSHQYRTFVFVGIVSSVSIVLLAAIVFAKTEAALVALAVSGALWGFFWSLKSRRVTLVFCVFVIFSIFISPPLAKTLNEKLFFKDWSGLVRKSMWRETIPMIRDNQILGAGFSGYQEKMKGYHKDTFIEIFQYPHTLILNFWSEMGILGLIAFELLVGWYFFILTKTLFVLRKLPQGDEKNFMRAVAAGSIFAMSTILIHGLVDVPYFKNDLAIFFWMLIGLAVAVYTNVEELRRGA